MDQSDDDQIPWPRPDQHVWSSDGSRDLAAWVSGGGDFYYLVEGYRTAAEVLVAYVSEGRHQDRLVYPIVFLWRHHLELRLKECVRLVYELRETGRDFPRTHRLVDLWSIVRSEIEKDSGSHDDCTNAEAIIRHLDAADPLSMAFRYPVDRDGAPMLVGIPRVVSIDVVHESLVGVANFLAAVSTEFSQRVEQARDWRRAYADLNGW